MPQKRAKFKGTKEDFEIQSKKMDISNWEIESNITSEHLNLIGRGRDNLRREKDVEKSCHWTPNGTVSYIIRANANFLTAQDLESPIEQAKMIVLNDAMPKSEADKIFDDRLTKLASRKIKKRGGAGDLQRKVPQRLREVLGQTFFHPIIKNDTEGMS